MGQTKRFLAAILSALGVAACEGEAPVVLMTMPELDGTLTSGRWERRGRQGLTFWPPGVEGTRLPELIDFSCIQGSRSEIRVTVTGDIDQTALWIASEKRTSKPVYLVTEEGETVLDFFAGQERLPSIHVRIDEDWLQPLLVGEGVIAMNAYGGRVYRIALNPLIGETVDYSRWLSSTAYL